jgi:hypothetical protein
MTTAIVAVGAQNRLERETYDAFVKAAAIPTA